MDSIIERLRKISALADSGVEGERENARCLLDALCKKYNIAPEVLLSEEMEFYEFRVSSIAERKLFNQVIVSILQTDRISHIPWRRQKIAVKLTKAQYLDIKDAFDHYLREWNKVNEDVFKAFIARHKLVIHTSESAPKVSVEYDEMIRVLGLASKMTSKQWVQLPKLTAGQTD